MRPLQTAIDANPGRMLFVPAGDYQITEKIRIRGERSGLFGPGRIIQLNADQPIIEIENANGAEIRDLTLTRPEGKMETDNEAVLAIQCRDLVIDNVRVIDNRTRSGAITLRECKDARISRCLVRNYMQVTVDDRTASQEWGYAFNCTDGTGISVRDSSGTLIEGNRVIEENLLPTPELKADAQARRLGEAEPAEGDLDEPGGLGPRLFGQLAARLRYPGHLAGGERSTRASWAITSKTPPRASTCTAIMSSWRTTSL